MAAMATVVISARGEGRVRAGHPWVYRADVLDVAAGAGDQTLQAAGRVGPGGSVLATDISPAILRFAASEARRAGHTNVTTRAMDGETLELEDASFDVVMSRVGLIYFPDQQRALAEMKRVLVPGGRVAAIVYSTADKNGFFSVPVSIIRRHAKLGAALRRAERILEVSRQCQPRNRQRRAVGDQR